MLCTYEVQESKVEYTYSGPVVTWEDPEYKYRLCFEFFTPSTFVLKYIDPTIEPEWQSTLIVEVRNVNTLEHI